MFSSVKEFVQAKANIYYRTNKFRQGLPTLVFVHGLSGSSSSWVKYEKHFEKKYNIVNLDLRGHGKSTKFRHYHEYEIKKFARDVHELLWELGIEKCVLVSHSFGTIIALEFLHAYPGMVERAIFLSPIFHVKEIRHSWFFRALIIFGVKFINFFPFRLHEGGHIDYSNLQGSGDWDPRRIVPDVWNTSSRVYFYCLKHVCEFDHDSFWGDIAIPILIMHGKKDTIAPYTNSIAMTKKIKNVQLVLLENANHGIVLNNFKEVSAELDEFLHARR